MVVAVSCLVFAVCFAGIWVNTGLHDVADAIRELAEKV